MASEAVLHHMRGLRARLATLVTNRAYAEMSNDRAATDGTLRSYDADIGQAKQALRSWYGSHPIEVVDGDKKMVVFSPDGGATFDLKALDMSRPGVLKQIDFEINDKGAELLSDFIGGRLVDYLGEKLPADVAFQAIERRFRDMAGELAKLRAEHRTALETIQTLNSELEGRFNDANS